jgi:hypothetical protein
MGNLMGGGTNSLKALDAIGGAATVDPSYLGGPDVIAATVAANLRKANAASTAGGMGAPGVYSRIIDEMTDNLMRLGMSKPEIVALYNKAAHNTFNPTMPPPPPSMSASNPPIAGSQLLGEGGGPLGAPNGDALKNAILGASDFMQYFVPKAATPRSSIMPPIGLVGSSLLGE